MYKVWAVIDCVSYVFLVLVCLVFFCIDEVIVVDEIMYFITVRFIWDNNYGGAFVCFELMALLDFSFSLIWLIIFFLCVIYVILVSLFIVLYIQFMYVVDDLVSYHYYSDGGNRLIAVSASKGSVVIQFLCLKCRLYLSPLLRRVISSLEKIISVLLIILVWKLVLVC